MDVSIIIINYKTYTLTKQCIESIEKHNQTIDYEIILVDNHSDDGSIEKLGNDFPDITIIENKKNVGFGNANNIGAAVATGKYLFLLNSDTIVKENSIYAMYHFMEIHSEYVSCGCNLVDKDGNNNISHGNLPSLSMEVFDTLINRLRLFRSYYNNKLSAGQTIDYGDLGNTGYISGADIFIRKAVFDRLEGFDHNIFMYFEETDLYARMRNLGLRSCVLTNTSIVHLEGGSIKKTNSSKFNLMEKSRMYYYRKHHSLFYCLLVKICVLLRVALFQKEDKKEFLKIVWNV